jgi:hypothetical protein
MKFLYMMNITCCEILDIIGSKLVVRTFSKDAFSGISMFEIPDLISRLANVSHFRGLSLWAVSEIVTLGNVQTHSSGSIIYHEGWNCAGLFVLFKGRVHLRKTCFQGQESIISVIDPVFMFNEVAVLDGARIPSPRSHLKKA